MPAHTPIALFTPDTFFPLCSLYLSLALYFMLSVYVTRPPSFFILALCLSDDVVTQKQKEFLVFYSEAMPTSSHFLMRPRVAEQQPIRHVKSQRGGFMSCLYDSSVSSWFKNPRRKKLWEAFKMWFCWFCGRECFIVGRAKCSQSENKNSKVTLKEQEVLIDKWILLVIRGGLFTWGSVRYEYPWNWADLWWRRCSNGEKSSKGEKIFQKDALSHFKPSYFNDLMMMMWRDIRTFVESYVLYRLNNG